jgi:hypothetical protein
MTTTAVLVSFLGYLTGQKVSDGWDESGEMKYSPKWEVSGIARGKGGDPVWGSCGDLSCPFYFGW